MKSEVSVRHRRSGDHRWLEHAPGRTAVEQDGERKQRGSCDHSTHCANELSAFQLLSQLQEASFVFSVRGYSTSSRAQNCSGRKGGEGWMDGWMAGWVYVGRMVGEGDPSIHPSIHRNVAKRTLSKNRIQVQRRRESEAVPAKKMRSV